MVDLFIFNCPESIFERFIFRVGVHLLFSYSFVLVLRYQRGVPGPYCLYYMVACILLYQTLFYE